MIVIDGVTNTTAATVSLLFSAGFVAVNPVTNKIYVNHLNNSKMTVIDGATNATTTLNVGTNRLHPFRCQALVEPRKLGLLNPRMAVGTSKQQHPVLVDILARHA